MARVASSGAGCIVVPNANYHSWATVQRKNRPLRPGAVVAACGTMALTRNPQVGATITYARAGVEAFQAVIALSPRGVAETCLYL